MLKHNLHDRGTAIEGVAHRDRLRLVQVVIETGATRSLP